MYCSKCGKEMEENANFCVHCGGAIEIYCGEKQDTVKDKPSGAMALLGFFFPFVGLILFLSLHGTRPEKARSARKGFLFGLILIPFKLFFVMFALAFLDYFIWNI